MIVDNSAASSHSFNFVSLPSYTIIFNVSKNAGPKAKDSWADGNRDPEAGSWKAGIGVDNP
jgi:hypothetical protein